ncbi:hypothetical protein BJV78DRAFT_1275022 [Lactifluus subvellereus]|nr:hypothetical protein BJV78DRAFT_1275022 [Lactifluus subvellereus]
MGTDGFRHLLSTPQSRNSYGTISEHQPGPSFRKNHSPETYRGGHPLFNVPEEIDEEDLEEPLEAEGLYLGSYSRLVQIYTIVPVASLLVWLLAASVPLLALPTHPSTIPHAPFFPTPLPELLLSISLFALLHLLDPCLFTLAGVLLPHPTAQSVLGTALHVLLRNALCTAAFPMRGLTLPSGIATFRAPAFRHVWWLALGWSLAEVVTGIAQGYETLALYRDVLVPEGRARELLMSEDGGTIMDVAGSPVRGRWPDPSSSSVRTTNDAEIQLEVDRDFDELVAVKAREELEELYGFPPIRVPVFVSCLLRVASILLSLGFVLLLSAGYLTSPLASPPAAEDVTMVTIPPSWTNSIFWGTFAGVCGINWSLSLLHTPVFLPRVGVHVVAYLGFLVGLGTLFAGLGMWDALS